MCSPHRGLFIGPCDHQVIFETNKLKFLELVKFYTSLPALIGPLGKEIMGLMLKMRYPFIGESEPVKIGISLT